ncbi:sulfite exporter TauE/SafE family protein, partial [Deltaproteobacteria bacterium OttesenSCG-928-K17]|nr:sulfite exporter TauE/SafE family protein [Deltaproteobacteria bacterium OttesenSCG-928-K17]
MYFPIADIDVSPLTPFIIGLAVSAVSSPTGISGGFLILPVSVNFLGFTSMAVSPTNYLFNILAMPSGI